MLKLTDSHRLDDSMIDLDYIERYLRILYYYIEDDTDLQREKRRLLEDSQEYLIDYTRELIKQANEILDKEFHEE